VLKVNQNHAKLRVFHYYSFVADPAPWRFSGNASLTCLTPTPLIENNSTFSLGQTLMTPLKRRG
jgi:hypothetical protein